MLTKHDNRLSGIDETRPILIERLEVSVPPSIALDGIERHLHVREGRLAVATPVKRDDEPRTLAITCLPLLTVHAHPNKALIARFDDRLEIAWDGDGPGCPSVWGRLTIRPLGTKTEMVFKGQYAWPVLTSTHVSSPAEDEDAVRDVVRCILGQFKDALETQFGAIKAFAELELSLRPAFHHSKK